uniref:DUF2407_C domain-containing protein n=1 Tax=Loa loa TaxID=7209 RepID=A0A1I7VVG4_LOALO
MIFFTAIQCQRISNRELDLFHPGHKLLKDNWMVEDEDGNCDVVEEALWSRYFFRGMIVGFLIGLCGGVLLGFLCWQVQRDAEISGKAEEGREGREFGVFLERGRAMEANCPFTALFS